VALAAARLHAAEVRAPAHDRDDRPGACAAARAPAGVGVRLHDDARHALHPELALASLEPGALRGRARTKDLYTATRHYFAWYALNVLEVDQKWIALQLGHHDGGKLVLDRYGQPDARVARKKIREAFAKAPTAPTSLDARREGSA
jgi:hypothetical protein